MTWSRYVGLLGLLAVATGSTVGAAEAPTLKVVDSAPPNAVAPDIAKLMAPTKFQLNEGDKEVGAFWFRAATTTTAEAAPVLYSSIKVGDLVGVVEFKTMEWSDFRNQELRPGVYTLRIAAHPQDGDHMGVAIAPEFLLLRPAEKDKEAGALEHDALMDLSAESLDTGHPAVLFLHPFYAEPTEQAPSITENDEGHVILTVKLKAKLANGSEVELPFGVVILGASMAA
jgi:hypothetical protein